jgi:hypothetical protein
MYVTRAAADLPLFHWVSRKKLLLARPATEMQSGVVVARTWWWCGIVGSRITNNQQATGNMQSMARTRTRVLDVDRHALYRLDLLLEGVWKQRR